jgi:ADP-ribosyl-[dinitrogen reductase] hydrolase
MDNLAAAPFVIAMVEVRPFSGWIGITPCPGTTRFTGRLDPLEGNLDADFKFIVAWGATAVVTLMHDRESRRPSIADLRKAAARASLEWHHLPIADGGVPVGEFEHTWTKSGPRLRAILRASGRVLVHCRGGLGRSGMIAARLLVELGEVPAIAIERVRHARPGAIETDLQEAHAVACRAIVDEM